MVRIGKFKSANLKYVYEAGDGEVLYGIIC